MNFIMILIATAVLQLFTPWWTISLVPFLITLWRPGSSVTSFLYGFLAIAILWFTYGLYLHIRSEGAMSNRIAEIFFLPNGILLLIITTVTGGLVGGLSGLAGYFVRKTIQ